MAQLKEYTIFAIVYYDLDGNPKIMWQLEKDGKGIMNPDLYQYLKKAGVYLDSDMFEFIDFTTWDQKIKNGWRNGYNYVTGETYNPVLSGLVAGSQYVEDAYTWLTQSELGAALQSLGFTYAAYRMTTSNGSVTVGKNASGTENIQKVTAPSYVPRDRNGKELGLPRHDNGKIVNGTSHIPESQFPHSQIGIKGGRNGKYIQTLEWGYDGKPIQRTDWTNHGRADHTNPHSHPAILKDGSWSFKK